MIPSHRDDFVRLTAESAAGYPLQRCRACGQIPNFPRVCCPRCLGELDWFAGTGTGIITACAIVRRTHAERYEPHIPIVMSHVKLTEGPEVIASIVGADRLTAAIGLPVRRAGAGSWSSLPQFEIAG